MTREELEKEVQENCVCTNTYMRANYITGYLAGAEPREKRIEELEQQIKEMKGIILCTCEGCSRLSKLYKAFEEIEK